MGFKLVSTAAFLVFYGGYFMKMLHQKTRGIQTDQIGRGKAGFVKLVEVTMKIAAVLVSIAGALSIFLVKSYSHTVIRVIGAAMSVGGTSVFLLAVLAMGDSWRAGVSKTDQTELVTDGVYRISRNPAFLGFDLLHIGTLLLFFNWALCVLTVFAVVMYHLQIVNVEERFLLDKFEDGYLQYKGTVRRYIGRRR